MRTPFFTILAIAVNSALAIDTMARRANFCTSYAHTNNSWTESNLRRRRVVYDTTKDIVQYDHEMYSLGWRWSNEKDVCKALAEDVKVYYNGLVIPGGAYVVDSSEVLGPDGDGAHECLLSVFRVMLSSSLNCTG